MQKNATILEVPYLKALAKGMLLHYKTYASAR